MAKTHYTSAVYGSNFRRIFATLFIALCMNDFVDRAFFDIKTFDNRDIIVIIGMAVLFYIKEKQWLENSKKRLIEYFTS